MYATWGAVTMQSEMKTPEVDWIYGFSYVPIDRHRLPENCSTPGTRIASAPLPDADLAQHSRCSSIHVHLHPTCTRKATCYELQPPNHTPFSLMLKSQLLRLVPQLLLVQLLPDK